MNENYLQGWELARLEYYDGSDYVPIACITSKSEQNRTNTQEKINVCTQGKTITKAVSISRTVSISGEVVDSNSLDDMKALQETMQEQTFKTYRTSGTTYPQWFKGIIMSVDSDSEASAEGGATFSMEIAVNGDYLNEDPN